MSLPIQILSKPRAVSDVYQSRPADGVVGTVPSAFLPMVPVRLVVLMVAPLVAFIVAATLLLIALPLVIR